MVPCQLFLQAAKYSDTDERYFLIEVELDSVAPKQRGFMDVRQHKSIFMRHRSPNSRDLGFPMHRWNTVIRLRTVRPPECTLPSSVALINSRFNLEMIFINFGMQRRPGHP
jgi:hypothetical protein